jgi:hypothetical protein
MLSITEDISAKQFRQSLSWQQFGPRSFRMITDTSVCRLLLSFLLALSWFWSIPMLLPARSLWYRVLCQKIPIQHSYTRPNPRIT